MDSEHIEQYTTTETLSARLQMHLAFSTAAIPWHQRVFDQIPLDDGIRVLLGGSGNG